METVVTDERESHTTVQTGLVVKTSPLTVHGGYLVGVTPVHLLTVGPQMDYPSEEEVGRVRRRRVTNRSLDTTPLPPILTMELLGVLVFYQYFLNGRTSCYMVEN